MARHFTRASADKIGVSTLPVLATNFGCSFWYRYTTTPGAFPNSSSIIYQGSNTASAINYFVVLDATTVSFVYTVTGNVTFAGPIASDTNIWHHVQINTDYTSGGTTIYVDGASQTVSTTGTPGVRAGSTQINEIGDLIGFDYMNGDIADLALWDVLLTAGEAKGLSQGWRPYNVRPKSLQRYWPLDGIQSPEPDLSGNANNGTLTGTSAAPGPPLAMFTPRWPLNIDVPAAILPGTNQNRFFIPL